MISILLSILRVIGLILLILLGIVLILLLLVLFMPVVYRVKAQRQETLDAAVKVRWLFGLLRAGFLYPEPGKFTVKLLFFTIYEAGGKEENTVKTSQDTDAEQPEQASGHTFDSYVQEGEKVQDNPDASDEAVETEDFKTSEEHAEAWREVEARLHGEKQESKFDKIKYTFRDTCDKIKDVWQNISYYKDILTENETRQLLDHAFVRLGKILKSIRPRKLEADLLFGTGSPDTTGYILGVYGMLSPFWGDQFLVTPDFEQKVLKGRLYVAGHITLAAILWQAILLVLDKKLWHLIAKVKKEKKHGK